MLTYLTRVAVPSQAAQSRQIQAMARAFHSSLGADFRLITGMGDVAQTSSSTYTWQQTPVYRNQSARQLRTILTGAMKWCADRHQTYYTRDLAVAFALGSLGAKVIYEAHQSVKGKIQRLMLETLRNRANFGLVVISKALGDHFEREHAIPIENILVAHDGVFLDDYPPITAEARSLWRSNLSIPSGAKFILHTGSLYKGGAELFGRFLRAAMPDTYLVQVGGRQHEHDLWRRHYGKDLGNRLLFLSHIPHHEISELQRSADFLLYLNTRSSPLYWCTSPLKLFEYMASGVPIVGSSIGSVAEVLNESNAFCFDPDAADSLELALCQAQLNPTEGIKRSGQARIDVERHYTWEGRVQQILYFAASRNLL